MRRFTGIVADDVVPSDLNAVWLDGTILRANIDGVWKVISSSSSSEILELTVGTTAEIKAANLAALGQKEHISYAKVNGGYGYGSVYWTMPPGGTVYSGLLCSMNPAGSTIWYNISSDGSIKELVESYDIYKQYCETATEKGETVMSNEQFNEIVMELVINGGVSPESELVQQVNENTQNIEQLEETDFTAEDTPDHTDYDNVFEGNSANA